MKISKERQDERITLAYERAYGPAGTAHNDDADPVATLSKARIKKLTPEYDNPSYLAWLDWREEKELSGNPMYN